MLTLLLVSTRFTGTEYELLIRDVEDLSIEYRLSFKLKLPDPLLREELFPEDDRDLFTLLPVPDPLLDLERLMLLPDPLDRLDPLPEVPLERVTFPELLPTEPDLPVLLILVLLFIPLDLTEDPLVLGV